MNGHLLDRSVCFFGHCLSECMCGGDDFFVFEHVFVNILCVGCLYV